MTPRATDDGGRTGHRTDLTARLVSERLARGWSQQRLVAQMRMASSEPLPSDDSMLRSLKGWEAADHRPSSRYRRLLSEVLETPMAVLFGEQHVDPVDGRESAVELVERLAASDIGDEVLDGIERQVERLCKRYACADPVDLLDEVLLWLRYVEQYRSARLSIGQHQRLVEHAGWLTLLVATVSFDLADRRTAEGARRAARRLGHEAGSVEIEAWALELSSWFNSARQRWERVVPVARHGREVAGGHGVGAQLAMQEAEALARLGQRAEAEALIGQAEAALERHAPAVDSPHHFHLTHDKLDKTLMHVHLLLGDDETALSLAEDLERRFVGSDGSMSKPMRVADARGVKAAVAARDGDIESAVESGHGALDIDRQTIPSLVKNTVELADALERGFGRHEGARELLERRRRLKVEAGGA